MAQNHYVTKRKRRNVSGKRKDTQRIAANFYKMRLLTERDKTKEIISQLVKRDLELNANRLIADIEA